MRDRATDRAMRSATPASGLSDAQISAILIVAGLIAVGALLAVTVVSAEEATAGLIHRALLRVDGMSGAARILGVAVTDPAHPERAWPPGARAAAPGAVPYWMAAALAVAGVAAALVRCTHMVRGRLGPGRAGFATRSAIRRETSVAAVRRRAPTIRPSLASRPSRAIAPEEAGMFVGQEWGSGRDVWLTREESLLIVGAPGEGKTARALVHLARRMRGPQVICSTKPDLLRQLAYLPELRDRPRWVVDFRGRTGLDGRPLPALGVQRSGWDLVAGCDVPSVAALRAQALVGVGYDTSTVREGGVWKARATSLVAYTLHAAALRDRDIRWVLAALGTEDFDEIRASLRSSPQAAPEWDKLVDGIAHLPVETRGGVLFGAAAGLACLSDHPELADLCRRAGGYPQVDVDNFFANEGVIFIVGSDDERLAVAPVVTAFVESIVAIGRARGQHMPRERLDPPLAVIVDEMARCPLRSARSLAAEGRGRGLTPVFVFQNLAQLRAAYGREGAWEILDAITAVMVMRGMRDPVDLDMLERWMPDVAHELVSQSTGQDGARSRSVSHRRGPAMSDAEIRELREGEALAFVRGMRPIDLRLRGPWELRRRERTVFESAEQEYVAAASRLSAISDPGDAAISVLADETAA